jgi:hypothetical protein
MSKGLRKEIILAPLPEELRIRVNVHKDGFKSKWFLSENNGILKFKFGKTIFEANLNIPVGDGSLLTDPKNEELFSFIKQWIHEQHYPRRKIMTHTKITAAKKKLWNILRTVDMFFLNAESLKIYRDGLSALTPGAINSYLDNFLKSNSSHESIYSWPEKLSEFLIERIQEPQNYDYDAFVKENPVFSEPVPEMELRRLPMQDDEIFRARVWLYQNGFYRPTEGATWPGTIRMAKIVKLLYPSCIMAQHMRPLPHELEIQSVYGYQRALPAIPVRKENSSATALRYNEFRNGLLSQRNLPHSPLKIPEISLSGLTNDDHEQLLASVGNYVTLPHLLTIKTLQQSVLFFDEHSETILNEISQVICNASKSGVSPAKYFSSQVESVIDAPVFKSWDLCAQSKASYIPEIIRAAGSKIRNREAALQSYYMLMGCIQYAVGYFTARRQAELLNLKFKHINANRNCLTVSVMKTGTGEHRLALDIPVIPIVIRMLSRLEKFHKDCGLDDRDIQEADCFGRFSAAKKRRITKANVKHYNSQLDIMCDYFETDTVDGRRYYIRQHQLRRAFAIGFYYLNDRGSLSVLSYFYGHMDFKQIYRYLTTTIGNKEMLDIKAAYLAEESLKDTPASRQLLDKMGISSEACSVTIIERDRLESKYRSLLDNKEVEVTPEFLDFNGCDKMLISIKVKQNNHGQ